MNSIKKRIISILAIILLVCLAMSGCQKETKEEKDFKNKWITGINTIEEKMNATIGVYENITEQELAEMFEELRKDVKNGLNDEKMIFIRLEEIVAACHHLHLRIGYTDATAYTDYHAYPLNYEWTKDGLVITKCTKEYADGLGAVIKSICGVSVDEFVSLLGTLRPWETLAGMRGRIHGFTSEELVFLGMIAEPSDFLEIEMEKDGEAISMEIEPIEYGKIASVDRISVWDEIDISKMPFRYRVEQRMKLMGHNTYYETDIDNGVMLLKYSSCFEDQTYFNQCFDSMINVMKKNDVVLDTFVIDISNNSGGNRFTLAYKLYEYQEYLLTKNIKLIIGYDTASAAVHAIEDVMTFFPDAKTYGSPTAGAIHNYTEIQYHDIPDINIQLVLPTIFDSVPTLKAKYGDIKDSVYPDYEVMVSYNDLLQGTDAVYDAIIGK